MGDGTTGRNQASALFADPEAAIAAAGIAVDGGQLVGSWSYTDSAGVEVMRVARFDLPDGSKQFRPVHAHKAGWRIGDPPGALPLYRLPELDAAQLVFVCEGEKTTDATRALGLVATTSAHGSGGAEKTDWTPLAGRIVVILPDNDDPGRKYAHEVARILFKMDPPAASVKIVALPGLPRGGDVVEFIGARPDTTAEQVREELVTIADPVPWLRRADVVGGPVLRCMATVVPRDIAWLWDRRIALGCVTLLAGRPGEGKSFLTVELAAHVSTGRPWPDGSPCPRGSAILISAEDDPEEIIRPRLDAHRADVRSVHLLESVKRISAEGKIWEVAFTLADVAAMEQALVEFPDCKLVVIDPIGSFLGGQTDAHRDNEVREILAPVARLARKHAVAMVVVAHHRKGAASSADDLAIGSRAFTGLARTVWHVGHEKSNKNRQLLLPGKNNLCPEGGGLAFSIQGEGRAAVVVWEQDAVTMTADEVMAPQSDDEKPGPEPQARDAAADWLSALMAAGEVPAAKVRQEAEAAGFVWRTVQRAAEALGVIREKNSFTGGWQWRFPKAGAKEEPR